MFFIPLKMLGLKIFFMALGHCVYHQTFKMYCSDFDLNSISYRSKENHFESWTASYSFSKIYK